MPETLRNQEHEEQINPITKMFIANRGEIAVRAINACIKRGIPAVVPYSFSDSDTLATRMAEEKDWELAAIGGPSQEESYANPKRILEEARLRQCDAIFLGYGFLAENSEFVRECEEKGIRVLAPNSQTMELTGNKIKARETANTIKIGRRSTIPTLEGTGNLETFGDAKKQALRLKFPIMLKDPDMGGGMGNRIVRTIEELQKAYEELRIRQNNREIFMERFVERAAHVEVQIAADQYGNVISLGERDCTMQRKNQKVIEESPSPNIGPATRTVIQKAAVNFAENIGYHGIGTWEFIVDLDRKGRNNEPAWYFIEVNPRIQVEHGVTEEQTGVDIVDLMIDIAEGRHLSVSEKDIKPEGQTIEVRLYGENPDREFAPSSGKINILSYPDIAGVRIDKGYEEGDVMSPWFDTTIAKVIAHGDTREEARRSLVKYLSQMEIAGISNNRDFLIELLNTPEFRHSKTTTTFIEQWWSKKGKERFQGIESFIGEGTFTPLYPSRKLDIGLLPQDVSVPSRGSDEPISYSQYQEQQKKRTGKNLHAEFGIMRKDGVQFALYYLNGALGIEEGIAFRDVCKEAQEKQLPLVTISTSGGADQHQNTLALTQMRATISALNNYPPPLHINIYTGGVYGGVPASFAGVADIQIAIDSPETNIGFTGPFIVAKTLGFEPKSPRKEDSYPELPEGTHTPLQHFQTRNIHVLEPSLRAASDKITRLLNLLELPATTTDSHKTYAPGEAIGYHELSTRGKRFDRPGQHFPTWLRRISGILWERHKSPPEGETILPPRRKLLPISERLKILENADRPTAADYIDKKSGCFTDTVLLSNSIMIEGTNQYPPVVAAIAKIHEENVLVLAHQTQITTGDKGKKAKAYDPQKPEDWEYTQHMISIARKLKLPIILLGDTAGADPLPESEMRNQSHKIAEVLRNLDLYPYPVLSVNIGIKGSGGGETFISPFDAAADMENALSFVSAPMVQYWIMTGRWIGKDSTLKQKKELEVFIEQLKDATSEGRLSTLQIDAIIPEGKGGAHNNPRIPADGLRSWLIDSLGKLKTMPSEKLLRLRRERLERITDAVTIPNL